MIFGIQNLIRKEKNGDFRLKKKLCRCLRAIFRPIFRISAGKKRPLMGKIGPNIAGKGYNKNCFCNFLHLQANVLCYIIRTVQQTTAFHKKVDIIDR